MLEHPVDGAQELAHHRNERHLEKPASASASWRRTVRGASGEALVVFDGSGNLMHWNMSGGLGRRDADGKTYYYLRDHLGSVRAVVRADRGTVVEARDYYAFGMEMAGRSYVNGTPTKESYTGHERDAETGLLYAGARYYDSAIGRWLVVDPLADDAMQVDKSPYAYTWNNPVNLTDPDGRCPWCIGAIVSGAVEFGSQVAVNMASGKSFSDAVRGVDYADVGIAAGVGAATGGLSTVKSLGTIAKTGIAVVSSVGEGAAKDNLGRQTRGYGLTEAALDAGAAGGLQRLADVGQTVAKGTQRGRQLQNQARRAENIAADGRPRASQTRRAQEARARAHGYGGRPRAQAVQAGTQSAVTGAVGAVMSGSNQNSQGRTVVTGGGGTTPADNTRVVTRVREEERQ